ncbi:MAG: siphovirus Gp157 family protein [Hyphomonadaceae bacterium]|nr:siphovirus Gp157 family protein [Hyphomonadaceae bacterium]
MLHHEALDDPEVMVVLAESETDLMQALDCMLDADICDDALIQGLKAAKDTMAARLHRIEERKKSRRAIIEQALLLLGCNTLQRPSATVSLVERPPSLVVEEEAQVPARFFDLKPVLNRRRAKDALEAGEDIAGARLSSGTITIAVRRR